MKKSPSGRAIQARAVTFSKDPTDKTNVTKRAKLDGVRIRSTAPLKPALKTSLPQDEDKVAKAPASSPTELTTETAPIPGPIGTSSNAADTSPAHGASGEDVCIELLVGGHVQSFVDLFHLTQTSSEKGTSSNQQETLSGDNLHYVKDKLISAEMSRRVGKTNNVYEAYTALADFFHTSGETDTSVLFYEKGLETAQASKNRLSEAKANHNMGVAQQAAGNTDKAIVYHERELAMAEDLEDEEQIRLAAAELSIVYKKKAEEVKDEDELLFREKCLAASKRSGNIKTEGVAHYYLGKSCVKLGQYARAISSVERYIEISKDLSDVKGEGAGCAVLAVALREQGKNVDAVRHLDRFLAIAKENHDKLAEAEACCTLGTTHNALGNFSDAVEHFQRYYDLSRNMLGSDASKENQKNVEVAKVYLGMSKGNERMNAHVFAIANDTAALLEWKCKRR